jgi:hypothetical protein
VQHHNCPYSHNARCWYLKNGILPTASAAKTQQPHAGLGFHSAADVNGYSAKLQQTSLPPDTHTSQCQQQQTPCCYAHDTQLAPAAAAQHAAAQLPMHSTSGIYNRVKCLSAVQSAVNLDTVLCTEYGPPAVDPFIQLHRDKHKQQDANWKHTLKLQGAARISRHAAAGIVRLRPFVTSSLHSSMICNKALGMTLTASNTP